MKKTRCPDCGGDKDYRAKRCSKCRFVADHPRFNTGSGWHVHPTLGYVMGSFLQQRFYQHRWIMEQLLGRKLEPWEHVHHKNGNKTDNRPANLELLSAHDHAMEHSTPEKMKAMGALGLAARWGKKAG